MMAFAGTGFSNMEYSQSVAGFERLMSLCGDAHPITKSKKKEEEKKKNFRPDIAVGDDTPHLHHIS